MPFSGTLVQFFRDLIAVLLVKICHARSFGQVLSYQTIRVLICPPLPGMVRCRKVEHYPCRLLSASTIKCANAPKKRLVRKEALTPNELYGILSI